MTFHRGAFLLLLAGGVVWITTVRRQDFETNPTAVPVQARSAPAPAAGVETGSGEPATDSVPNPEPGKSGSGVTPLTALENLRSVFRQYNSRLGGNPVGDNAEIAAALNGRNARHVVFLRTEEGGVRINERGELVDHWNTPYFFRLLSRTEMEIRSAGPDRRMWTADDLVIR